jgi:hypothetical protein
MVERRLWVRVVAFVLGIQPFVTGLWAVADPHGFYSSFPGLGRHWVAVDGPYNHHLIVDAGSGFLAVGVVLIVAALWARREFLQAAALALVVDTLPHFAYHASHPSPALSSTDNALSIGGLGAVALVGVVYLLAITLAPAPAPVRAGATA